MRTTIDLPDDLLDRSRPILKARKMTLRALVIDSLQKLNEEPRQPFQLRDASAGALPRGGGVSSKEINAAIDEGRGLSFRG